MTEAIERSSPLALLPAGFFELSGSKKVNTLLSLEDPAAFIQGLREDEFYFLVHDIGPSDSLELVEMSTPEQRVALIDFDAWEKDELAPGELDNWLDLLWHANPDIAVETVRSLDPELLTTYLMRSVVAIFDRTEEDEIRDASGEYEIVTSPDMDFTFLVDPAESDAVAHLRRLLDLLWRGDGHFGRSVIFSARSGLLFEQTELAYGFRMARLADLGFPDLEVAWQLFAPVDPDRVKRTLELGRASGGSALHVALARSGRPARFLNAALDAAESPEAFLVDFGFMVNRAVVVSPNGMAQLDPERLAPLARRVHATISLGLEWIADGSVSHAAELLRGGAAPLVLHQVGHALAMKLARRATPLAPKVRGLLEPADQALLDGLGTRPGPSYAGRSATVGAIEARAFETVAELTDADARLTTVENLFAAFEGAFGFNRAAFEAHAPGDPALLTLQTLAATLVAHLLVNEVPSFEPLDGAALTAAAGQLERLDAVVSEWAQRVTGAEVALAVGAAALRDTLGGIRGPVDPRFVVGALRVRAGE